jgi:hypothetical protein
MLSDRPVLRIVVPTVQVFFTSTITAKEPSPRKSPKKVRFDLTSEKGNGIKMKS